MPKKQIDLFGNIVPDPKLDPDPEIKKLSWASIIAKLESMRKFNPRDDSRNAAVRKYLIVNRSQLVSLIHLGGYADPKMVRLANTLFDIVFKYLDYEEKFRYLEGISLEPSIDYEHKEFIEIGFYRSICNLILDYHHTDIARRYLHNHIYWLFPHLLDIKDKDEELYSVLLRTKNAWLRMCKKLNLNQLMVLKKLFGLESFFDDLLYSIEFSWILKLIKGTELMSERLNDVINIFINRGNNILNFSELILSVKETNLLNSNYSLFEELFTKCITVYMKNPCLAYRNDFIKLLSAINGTKLLSSNYSLIEKMVMNLLNVRKVDQNTFTELVLSITGTKLISQKFSEILNTCSKFNLWPSSLKKVFSSLVTAIDDTKTERFIDMLNVVKNIRSSREKIYAFATLVEVSKGTKLIKIHHTLIENMFNAILIDKTAIISNLDGPNKGGAFTSMVKAFKGTMLIKKNLSLLKERYPEYYEYHFGNKKFE